MKPKKITSIPGIFGSINHYDENGKFIGYSQQSPFGWTNHYDDRGSYSGSSTQGLFGSTNHYNSDGKFAGYSGQGLFGSTEHYNEDNEHVGYSVDSIFGRNTYEDENIIRDETMNFFHENHELGFDDHEDCPDCDYGVDFDDFDCDF